MSTRLLICGGRDFNDRDRVFGMLDAIKAELGPIECVIHGAARGADSLGGLWAMYERLWCWAEKADWDTHGKAAGPIRNQRMLDIYKPTFCVAFPGGTGTADMIRRCKAAGVPVQLG